MDITELPFVPARWLRGPHQQTIAGAYWGRPPRYQATAHTITLPDGDQLVLHEDLATNEHKSDRIALLVHGLAGCHRSPYMARIAAKLSARGVRVYRLDLRGCGSGAHLARHSLHAGRTDDLAQAIDLIATMQPHVPITLVGFSLGASLVLRLLTRCANQWSPPVHAAIAVCPPLDLAACCQAIRRGLNRLYDAKFVRTLCRQVADRRRAVTGFVDRPLRPTPRSLYDFDAQFTAPLGGFVDVVDYYNRSSCFADLSHIEVPTTILFAHDDPMIPSEIFHRAQVSNSTRIYATKHGGHLGYLADRRAHRNDPDWHWLDWRIVEWITGRSLIREA